MGCKPCGSFGNPCGGRGGVHKYHHEVMIAVDHHASTSVAPNLPGVQSRGNPAAGIVQAATRAWRYDGVGWTRIPLVFAVFVSIGLHVFFLFGFNNKTVAKRVVATEEVEIIQMTMPDLEEEKPDTVEELTEQADEAPALSVPQLADLPSSVAVATFTQPLQYTPDVSASLNAAKATQIPVNIGRSRNLQNMGTIFEISQLDRVPTPVMQPAPVFPFALKQTVSEAHLVVEFIVDSNGDVVAPFVASTTHTGFNEAAIAGVAKWKFRPGMKAGKRVNTRVRVPVNFFISDED
ncbi:MAG: hypothetical protein C0518_03170 [Opitutus sp.]|nr:hypothetical protein [Opitutus sp.]